MQVEYPTTVEAAIEALGAWPDATLLAGGTDLMVEVNYRHRRLDRVITLRRIGELRELTADWIGAGVTHARLEDAPWSGLADAAKTVGSPQIRSVGTIGGNLGTASPAGDTFPFLAAVDASIVLRSNQGERVLPWKEFFTGPKRTARRPGELIIGVRLPDHLPERQAFAKVGRRSAMVIAIVSACVTRDDAGRVTVALGAVGPTVLRAREAEEMINAESRPTTAALGEFQRRVEHAARPIDDVRATAEYRRHAAGVLARRLLERVW